MLSAVNFWMSVAGLFFLITGIFILRKELIAARGWDRLILLAPVLIAASLAIFAPEHFRGPEFVQSMVPSWMPGPHRPWAYFVGCALLAAAASLTFRRFLRPSSIMLAIMFSLFVCMLYLPSLLRHLGNRFAWIFVLRDLSFAAGAWALAGLYHRSASPQASKWMVGFSRYAIAFAAIFYSVQHFLFPLVAPGVPLQLLTPSWVPLPRLWGYLTGVVLLGGGIGLALNLRPRMSATAIGAVMTILTLFLYLPILLISHGDADINQGLNYVGDTLLYGGSALALALALPQQAVRTER